MKTEGMLKKLSILSITIYILFFSLFYLIVEEQYSYGNEFKITGDLMPKSNTGEILKNHKIEQIFNIKEGDIKRIDINLGTYNRINTSNLFVKLVQNGKYLYEEKINSSVLKDNSFYTLKNKNTIKINNNSAISLIIMTDSEDKENSVALWLTKTGDETREKLYINDKVQGNKALMMDVYCVKQNNFKKNYFIAILIGFSTLLIYLFLLNFGYIKKENTIIYRIYINFKRYRFLIKQLVDRDFKTKYRRSILGVLWSLLNPLLTMTVQYIVFSNLFKFDIENYVIYLLIGIIIFNFFSETTSQTIGVIINNAGLITKVFIPKLIYPISKVFSITVNLLLSFIPLVILVFANGLSINRFYLLLPIGIVLFLIFCLGIALILSTLMVFFRDVEFLWGVLIVIWMYLTPIFYPESILPEFLGKAIKFNPLYQYINFFRDIILNGIAPSLMQILICVGFSILSLLLGIKIFKANENKFILKI